MLPLSFLMPLLVPSTQAATHDPGVMIDQALVVDIPPDGFEAFEDLLPSIAPPAIEIDGTGGFYGGLFDQCWIGGYEYAIGPTDADGDAVCDYCGEGAHGEDGAADMSPLWVAFEFEDMEIVPMAGYLQLTADILVNVNSSDDPFGLLLDMECLESVCDAYVDPFPVEVTTQIALEVIDDDVNTPYLDATIGDLTIDYELGSDEIEIYDCTAFDIIEFIDDYL
ncbi:MAG: hypothetical protein QGG40_17020, partial [Myxococcota bacterium]|nr:hypothetical protein [Myxococcota bacterium]